MFKDKTIRKQSCWYFAGNMPLGVAIEISKDVCASSKRLRSDLLSRAITLEKKGLRIDAKRVRTMAEHICLFNVFRGRGYYILDGELYMAKGATSSYIYDFVKRRRIYTYVPTSNQSYLLIADIFPISGDGYVTLNRKLTSSEERFFKLRLYETQIKKRMSGDYHAE